MSLQLIFGGSGSGKSDYVYRSLLEQSKIGGNDAS